MKKVTIFLVLAIILSPIALIAQDEEEGKKKKKKDKGAVERPANIGVSDFDEFKNSSFDIMEESATLKASLTQINNEIENYSGAMNTVSVDKLKTNLKALLDSKNAIGSLTENIGGLLKQGAELLKNAKGMTPKTKSVKASGNTNKAIKGLNIAKDDLAAIGSLLAANVESLTAELKARGEPIE